jgi:hypothetical protein
MVLLRRDECIEFVAVARGRRAGDCGFGSRMVYFDIFPMLGLLKKHAWGFDLRLPSFLLLWRCEPWIVSCSAGTFVCRHSLPEKDSNSLSLQ